MKTLLTMALVLLLAGSAFAQHENSMGMFFSDTELTEGNTNFDPSLGVPFNAYLALMGPTQFSVGGYEVGVSAPATLLALAVTGPNGWTNFGSNFNHLCGYGTPVPSGGDVVLCTFQLLYTGTETAEIMLGASTPSSVGGEGPAIADGTNPDILIVCNYTGAAEYGNVVATLNGAGIMFPPTVATRSASLSDVKALFE